MSCGIDRSFQTGCGHYYTVRREVWLAAVPEGRGELCIDCLEARLGRKLVSDDFVRTPFEIMASFAGRDADVEQSLRARGRADLADEAARSRREREEWKREQERHWESVRDRLPGVQDD